MAAAAGKAIYCEKPTATNVDEALRIADIVESHGLKNGVVQDKLWLPAFRKPESPLFSLIHQVANLMIGQGECPRITHYQIINISSISADTVSTNRGAYCLSNWQPLPRRH